MLKWEKARLNQLFSFLPLGKPKEVRVYIMALNCNLIIKLHFMFSLIFSHHWQISRNWVCLTKSSLVSMYLSFSTWICCSFGYSSDTFNMSMCWLKTLVEELLCVHWLLLQASHNFCGILSVMIFPFLKAFSHQVTLTNKRHYNVISLGLFIVKNSNRRSRSAVCLRAVIFGTK